MHRFSLWLADAWVIYQITCAPFLGKKVYCSFLKKLKNDPHARIQFYLKFFKKSLITTIMFYLIFMSIPNPFQSLGLAVNPDNRSVIAICALLYFGVGLSIAWTVSKIRMRNPKFKEKILKRFEQSNLIAMLPTTPQEQWVWYAVAICVGIYEELIFRGFLIFYFTHVFPKVSFFTAACISSLAFGFTHIYQGRRGIILTTFLGLAFACLYWATGSLILSMTLHILIDLQFGFYSPVRNPVIKESTT